MPAAARYATHLGDEDSLENIFEEDDEGDFVVDTDDDGLCFFAYRDCRDRIFCSLHSVAMELQVPYHSTKPMSCVLWPLAISEDEPLQLSIADDAFDFPCNKRRNNPGQSLHPNIAQIIRDVFGPDLLSSVEKACATL